MAERRMFNKSITESDAFVTMPLQAQALYFHLGMIADDDGVINNATVTMRMINAKNKDLNLLIEKKFILELENGIYLIKHWKINNFVRKDLYHKSKYQDLLEKIEFDDNLAYRFKKSDV